EAMALIQRDMGTAVDPRRDALAAQVLFLLGPDHHIWYQRIHHLVIDGYGTTLLTSRIADLYRAAITDTTPRTAPLVPRAVAVAAEREYIDSDRYASDRQFWRDQFADQPDATSLVPRAALTSHTYMSRSVDLPAEVSDGLV